MNEAAMAALDEKLRLVQSGSEGAPLTITELHFQQALEKISPSVSDKVSYLVDIYILIYSWFCYIILLIIIGRKGTESNIP